ncbi:MAG: SRPBCC domain-containing protein [Candidatus Acidiferrum sp.]
MSREIWHEILINASAAEIYDAVTDAKKLAHWWTTDTRGVSVEGGTLEFWFGGMCQAMEVTLLEPGELVRWKAKQGGAPGWADTQLEFKIFRDKSETFLHLRHSNWLEEAALFPHCSMGWAIFLLSLKEFVETGKGRPFPYDMPVNLWEPPHS